MRVIFGAVAWPLLAFGLALLLAHRHENFRAQLAQRDLLTAETSFPSPLETLFGLSGSSARPKQHDNTKPSLEDARKGEQEEFSTSFDSLLPAHERPENIKQRRRREAQAQIQARAGAAAAKTRDVGKVREAAALVRDGVLLFSVFISAIATGFFCCCECAALRGRGDDDSAAASSAKGRGKSQKQKAKPQRARGAAKGKGWDNPLCCALDARDDSVALAFLARAGLFASVFVGGSLAMHHSGASAEATLDQLFDVGGACAPDAPSHMLFCDEVVTVLESVALSSLAIARGGTVGALIGAAFRAAASSRWGPAHKAYVSSLGGHTKAE
jgi:hypothetical protein